LARPLSSTNHPKRLTKDVAPSASLDVNPDWSPDGTKIVFETNRDAHFDIAVMDSDGSNQHLLTDDAPTDESPVFSPDGSLILYERGGDLYVMQANGLDAPGTDNTNTNTVSETNPSWQPQ